MFAVTTVTAVQLNELIVSKNIIEQILHWVVLHYITSFIPAVCFYLSIFFCHYKKKYIKSLCMSI